MEIPELYSPPRVTVMAEKMGMRSEWALDLATQDGQGNVWNFNGSMVRNNVVRKFIEDYPLLFIGSPSRTNWSTIMNLNWNKMNPTEVAQRKQEARGRLFFLHEAIQDSAQRRTVFPTRTSRRSHVMDGGCS